MEVRQVAVKIKGVFGYWIKKMVKNINLSKNIRLILNKVFLFNTNTFYFIYLRVRDCKLL